MASFREFMRVGNVVPRTESAPAAAGPSKDTKACKRCEQWSLWPRPRNPRQRPWPFGPDVSSHFKKWKIIQEDLDWYDFFSYFRSKNVHSSICYKCWSERNTKKLFFNVYDTCPLLFVILCYCPRAPYPIIVNEMAQFYGDLPLRETMSLTFTRQLNQLSLLIDKSIEKAKKTPSHKRLVLTHKMLEGKQAEEEVEAKVLEEEERIKKKEERRRIQPLCCCIPCTMPSFDDDDFDD